MDHMLHVSGGHITWALCKQMRNIILQKIFRDKLKHLKFKQVNLLKLLFFPKQKKRIINVKYLNMLFLFFSKVQSFNFYNVFANFSTPN